MSVRHVSRALSGRHASRALVDARVWAAQRAQECAAASSAWRSVAPTRLRAALSLSAPGEWYAGARQAGPRRIVACVGPTNSGKTHGALARLVDVARAGGAGVYCAPLRLLAVETWRRLRAEHGVPCALVTGETRVPADAFIPPGDSWPLGCAYGAGNQTRLDSDFRPTIGNGNEPPGSQGHSAGQSNSSIEHGSTTPAGSPGSITACTVEMADLSAQYDVAVVDEAQLAADAQRGWAFTSALLGLRARELYVCGEEAVVPLLAALAAETGDLLEVRRHARLAPLVVESAGLGGSLSNLRPGDALVAFSRRELYALRDAIGARRAAIVYGRLPVEARVAQAAAFNARRADILLASDAIGLGLNLRVGRVVFASVAKAGVPVPAAALRQIAGRAGRFGAGVPEGRVTALCDGDLPAVAAALRETPQPYAAAGLQPPAERLLEAARRLPALPLEALMTAVSALRAPAHYAPGYAPETTLLVHLLGRVPRLSPRLRLALASAPVPLGRVPDLVVLSAFETMAGRLAAQTPCPAPQLAAVLAHHPAARTDPAAALEAFCRVAELYVWLAARHPGVFPAVDEALAMRATAVARIAAILDPH